MPKPRKHLVSLEATPYYHLVSRCVRRAFLCGFDKFTGRSFEHRRQWLEDRLLALAGIFAIDICAYAIMSNHYHLVVHINKDKAESWTEKQVIQRWHQLFNGTVLSQRYIQGEHLSESECEALSVSVEQWRNRLFDISWLMRCLNEPLARLSNKEDECTGRFWEGRYKSQALLDEKSLAAAMVYVDLNPVRAGTESTPESSKHTSAKLRTTKAKSSQNPNAIRQQPTPLYPFAGNPRNAMPKGLPFVLTDYLELIDWTARQIRDKKKGIVDATLPPLLTRLGIEPKQWQTLSTDFEGRTKSLVGSLGAIRNTCSLFGKRWIHGLQEYKLLFG